MSTTDWLSRLVVVDAGTTPAARYCGWLFAHHGATVVDAGRPSSAQLLPATVDFLDSGKRPVDELPARADVLLADGPLDGLPTARLTGIVDAFGADGPRAGWVADEMVLAAMGGAAAYTRGRTGEPVYGFGHRYQYLAGLYLYTALLAQLDVDDDPHEIRVSLYETVASLLPYATTQYVYNGSDSLLEQSGPRFVVGCSDGWVVVYAGLAWPALVGMLGRDDLLTDTRFVDLDERFRHVTALGEVCDAWGARHTVAEALALASQYDVAATAVRSPAEVLADPELAARGVWSPVRGGGLAPSLPYLLIHEGADDVA